MTSFTTNQALRSVFGVFAAVLIGGTFLTAAAGPAYAAPASQVNVSIESNIVRGY